MANINVDPKKLEEFADYVSNFKLKIQTHCDFLNDASKKFESTLDPEDASYIKKTTTDIARVLDDAAPDLKELERRIRDYAAEVTRIRKKAGG